MNVPDNSHLMDGEAASIIYNVTVKVDVAIAAAWLNWLLNEQAPEMLATGCFSSYSVVKLLDVDESDGPTYAVQYRAKSKGDYQKYVDEFATLLAQKADNKWGRQCVDFATVMEVVYEQ